MAVLHRECYDSSAAMQRGTRETQSRHCRRKHRRRLRRCYCQTSSNPQVRLCSCQKVHRYAKNEEVAKFCGPQKCNQTSQPLCTNKGARLLLSTCARRVSTVGANTSHRKKIEPRLAQPFADTAEEARVSRVLFSTRWFCRIKLQFVIPSLIPFSFFALDL